jgi:hypothetical protein
MSKKLIEHLEEKASGLHRKHSTILQSWIAHFEDRLELEYSLQDQINLVEQEIRLQKTIIKTKPSVYILRQLNKNYESIENPKQLLEGFILDYKLISHLKSEDHKIAKFQEEWLDSLQNITYSDQFGEDYDFMKDAKKIAKTCFEVNTIKKYYDHLRSLHRKLTNSSQQEEHDNCVQHTSKFEKTAFAQLIHSLMEAGYIINMCETKNKAISKVAKSFGFDSNTDWTDLISTAKTKRNHDYVPPIFDALKKAYLEFSNREKK